MPTGTGCSMRGERLGQLLGDPHAAASAGRPGPRLEAVVALDDLVGNAGQGPAHIVGTQNLSGPRRWRHDFLPRIGLTGPISRSAVMLPVCCSCLSSLTNRDYGRSPWQ